MSDTRQCENCKTDVDGAATFCPQCGHRFEAPAPAVAPPAPVAPVAAAPPPSAPPPMAPAAPPPPVAAPVSATPYVVSTPVKRSSPWPAILIGCGVLFLLVVVIGGYAGYKGYQKAKASVQAEMEQSTPTGGAEGDATQKDDGTAGAGEGNTAGESDDTEGKDETTPSDQKPVIEVAEGMDPNRPPRAYAVEKVPPVEVEEGREFGPVTTGDQAAGLVLAQADVQTWAAQIKEARDSGKKRYALVTVELIPGSENFLVHLFESVADEEPGHTATFGWFKVDKETGAVTNETI